MLSENILLAFVVVFAGLALLALSGWLLARNRHSVQRAISDDLRAENAALRNQVNKRGAGGRFAPKNTTN